MSAMAGFEITDSFAEPFSEITQALPASYAASVVGLDGKAYLIDTESGKYRQTAVEVLQQRNTGDNRDLLLLPQNIWRQTQSSWHYGAGQSNLDRDDAFPYRFDQSYGIDVFNKWQISLLKKTESIYSSANSEPIFAAVLNNKLVVAQDNDLTWFNDTSDSGTAQALSNRIVDLISDGEALFALDYQGMVVQVTDSSTSSNYANLGSVSTAGSASFIGYNKDFFVGASGNKFIEFTGGVTTTVYTHPIESFRWVDSCDGPNAIYAVGSSGDRSFVHRFSIKDDGSGLNVGIVAATLPDGEVGYSIGEYLGYVFIGTSKGVRMAQPAANGDLTLGALIPTPRPVRSFEGQDRFVWFGLDEMVVNYTPSRSDDRNLMPNANVFGLGRMDLSTFTTTALTPAYANDLSVAGQGTNKAVRSVLTWNDVRVFTADGVGVYYEGTDLIEGGYLNQGLFSFSVEDLKSALYLQAKWLPGCSGRIYIDMAFDSTGFTRYATLQVSNSTIRSDNVNLFGIRFSRGNARYVLVRCPLDNTVGPVLTRFEIRSMPVRGKASRWTVPVMNYEEVEIEGTKIIRDVTLVRDQLQNLVDSGKVFVYQESGRAHQVIARDFEWLPEKLSSNSRGWQGVYTLVIEEVL